MNYVSIIWYEPENMGEPVSLAESEWIGEREGEKMTTGPGDLDHACWQMQNLLFKF